MSRPFALPILRLLSLAALWSSIPGFTATLSVPIIRSNTVTISLDTVTNEVVTLQGSDTLPANWSDISHVRGTGARLDLSVPLTDAPRFFRTRSIPYHEVTLEPNSPGLTDGSVSLPDAVTGTPYAALVSPAAGSGFPPYTLSISGSPPDGVTVELTGNASAEATVRIVTDGSATVPGQRRQFTITAVDAVNVTNSVIYDLRVIEAAPQIETTLPTLKAGEAVDVSLRVVGGTQQFNWSLLSGALPAGVQLATNGVLSGTPSADAAEQNEDGLHPVVFEVSDGLVDRVTGAPAPRKATLAVQLKVRLSYRLNIHATRVEGPSFRATCLACHGPGFLPDFASESALSLVDVSSGSGQLCGTSRIYVIPGSTAESLIYSKLSVDPACGDRMPQGGPYFSDKRLERIGRWIRELTTADAD